MVKVKITEEKFSEVLSRMSENAFKDACTLTNPRSSSPQDVEMLYKAAYYGKDV